MFSQFMKLLQVTLDYLEEWHDIAPSEVQEVEIVCSTVHVSSVWAVNNRLEVFLSLQNGVWTVYHVNDYSSMEVQP